MILEIKTYDKGELGTLISIAGERATLICLHELIGKVLADGRQWSHTVHNPKINSHIKITLLDEFGDPTYGK